MTVVLNNVIDIRRNAKATRPSGDHPVLESQSGEKYKARLVPPVWERRSVVDRGADHAWWIVLALVAVCVVVGAWIATW
jgi:hypothetical protein